MATKNKKKSKKTRSLHPIVSGVEDHAEDHKSLQGLVSGEEQAAACEQRSSVTSSSPRENSGQEQGSEYPRPDSESNGAGAPREEIRGSGKKSKQKKNKKTMSDVPSVSPSTEQSQGSSDSKEKCKCYTFEEQVEWCVGQLELGLLRRGATKAQKDSNEKNIKTLTSAKVPVPRKRQLMRSLFGDYRSKMVSVPLPKSSAKQPTVSAVEKDVAEDCGKFFRYKQSHFKSPNEPQEVSTHSEPPLFTFDFVVDL